MELTNYAKLPNAQLLCLIGLQQNFKKTIFVPDVEASGCKSCPHSPLNQYNKTKQVDTSLCENCPSIVFKQKTEYVNEANTYGRPLFGAGFDVPPRLKANAIKLFIAIVFCIKNTKTGEAAFSITEMAELLQCNRKTVLNNLIILSKYEYIHYMTNASNEATVIIRNYKKTFATAPKEGRGYITIDSEFFHRIISITQINDLRLCLRLLIETYLKNAKKQSVQRAVFTSDELKKYFPQYVRKSIIINSLNNLNPIFQDITIKPNGIGVTLNQRYNFEYTSKNLKAINYSEINRRYIEITTLLKDFNDSFDTEDLRFEKLGIELPELEWSDITGQYEYKQYSSAFLNNELRVNLSNLSIEYSLSEVLNALTRYVNDYVRTNTAVANFGGLIRSLILEARQYYSPNKISSKTA